MTKQEYAQMKWNKKQEHKQRQAEREAKKALLKKEVDQPFDVLDTVDEGWVE